MAEILIYISPFLGILLLLFSLWWLFQPHKKNFEPALAVITALISLIQFTNKAPVPVGEQIPAIDSIIIPSNNNGKKGKISNPYELVQGQVISTVDDSLITITEIRFDDTIVKPGKNGFFRIKIPKNKETKISLSWKIGDKNWNDDLFNKEKILITLKK